jgi:hypothetical protein
LLPLQVDEPSLIIYSDKVTNHLSVHCLFLKELEQANVQ